MTLPDAFQFRDSVYSRNEFEEYAYWKSDLERKDKDSRNKNNDKNNEYMKSLAPAETRGDVMDHAMSSWQNYLGFIQSRGYNGSAG